MADDDGLAGLPREMRSLVFALLDPVSLHLFAMTSKFFFSDTKPFVKPFVINGYYFGSVAASQAVRSEDRSYGQSFKHLSSSRRATPRRWRRPRQGIRYKLLRSRGMESWYRYGDSNPGPVAENHVS